MSLHWRCTGSPELHRLANSQQLRRAISSSSGAIPLPHVELQADRLTCSAVPVLQILPLNPQLSPSSSAPDQQQSLWISQAMLCHRFLRFAHVHLTLHITRKRSSWRTLFTSTMETLELSCSHITLSDTSPQQKKSSDCSAIIAHVQYPFRTSQFQPSPDGSTADTAWNRALRSLPLQSLMFPVYHRSVDIDALCTTLADTLWSDRLLPSVTVPSKLPPPPLNPPTAQHLLDPATADSILSTLSALQQQTLTPSDSSLLQEPCHWSLMMSNDVIDSELKLLAAHPQPSTVPMATLTNYLQLHHHPFSCCSNHIDVQSWMDQLNVRQQLLVNAVGTGQLTLEQYCSQLRQQSETCLDNCRILMKASKWSQSLHDTLQSLIQANGFTHQSLCEAMFATLKSRRIPPLHSLPQQREQYSDWFRQHHQQLLLLLAQESRRLSLAALDTRRRYQVLQDEIKSAEQV